MVSNNNTDPTPAPPLEGRGERRGEATAGKTKAQVTPLERRGEATAGKTKAQGIPLPSRGGAGGVSNLLI